MPHAELRSRPRRPPAPHSASGAGMGRDRHRRDPAQPAPAAHDGRRGGGAYAVCKGDAYGFDVAIVAGWRRTNASTRSPAATPTTCRGGSAPRRRLADPAIRQHVRTNCGHGSVRCNRDRARRGDIARVPGQRPHLQHQARLRFQPPGLSRRGHRHRGDGCAGASASPRLRRVHAPDGNRRSAAVARQVERFHACMPASMPRVGMASNAWWQAAGYSSLRRSWHSTPSIPAASSTDCSRRRGTCAWMRARRLPLSRPASFR